MNKHKGRFKKLRKKIEQIKLQYVHGELKPKKLTCFLCEDSFIRTKTKQSRSLCKKCTKLAEIMKNRYYECPKDELNKKNVVKKHKN